MQVRAVKPNFSQHFHLIAAAQNGQDIVPGVLVVELPQRHGFFLADFRPEQGVQKVLRPQILDGLAAGPLDGHRPNEELFLRRNRNPKGFAVAGHVEDCSSNHRRLPDHANLCGPCCQKKGLNFMILIDDTAILRSRGRLQFHGSVQSFYAAGDQIVGLEELFTRGILGDRPLRDDGMAGHNPAARTAAGNRRQCQQDHACFDTSHQ